MQIDHFCKQKVLIFTAVPVCRGEAANCVEAFDFMWGHWTSALEVVRVVDIVFCRNISYLVETQTNENKFLGLQLPLTTWRVSGHTLHAQMRMLLLLQLILLLLLATTTTTTTTTTPTTFLLFYYLGLSTTLSNSPSLSLVFVFFSLSPSCTNALVLVGVSALYLPPAPTKRERSGHHRASFYPPSLPNKKSTRGRGVDGGGYRSHLRTCPYPARPHPCHRQKAQKVCGLNGSVSGVGAGGQSSHHYP